MPAEMFEGVLVEEIYINEYTIFSENFMNNSGLKKIEATNFFEVKTNSFNNCSLEEFNVDYPYYNKDLMPNFSTMFEYNTFSNLKNLKEIDVLLLGNGVFNNCNFTKFTCGGIPIVEVESDYVYHTQTYESELYKEAFEKYGAPYCGFYLQNNMVFRYEETSRNKKISGMALFLNDTAHNKHIKLIEGQEIANTFMIGNDFTFDLSQNDIYEIDELGNLVEVITFKDGDNKVEKELTLLVKALKDKFVGLDSSIYDAIASFAFNQVELVDFTLNTGTMMSYITFYNCKFENLKRVIGACEYENATLARIDLFQYDDVIYPYGSTNPYFQNKRQLIVCIMPASG